MSSDEKNLSTGVEGIEADDTYQTFPVFDVTKEDFFTNLRKNDWNKVKFPDESKPAKFIKNSPVRSMFYARYTDDKGEQFLKKIK